MFSAGCTVGLISFRAGHPWSKMTKWRGKSRLTSPSRGIIPSSEMFRLAKPGVKTLQPKSGGAAFTQRVSVCIIWNQTLLIPSDLLPAAGSPAEVSLLLLQICGLSRKSHVSYPNPCLFVWSRVAPFSNFNEIPIENLALFFQIPGQGCSLELLLNNDFSRLG